MALRSRRRLSQQEPNLIDVDGRYCFGCASDPGCRLAHLATLRQDTAGRALPDPEAVRWRQAGFDESPAVHAARQRMQLHAQSQGPAYAASPAVNVHSQVPSRRPSHVSHESLGDLAAAATTRKSATIRTAGASTKGLGHLRGGESGQERAEEEARVRLLAAQAEVEARKMDLLEVSHSGTERAARDFTRLPSMDGSGGNGPSSYA
eukprot:SAG31_NODE_14037_length_830_cov_1.548564_1_plen_205_part_10